MKVAYSFVVDGKPKFEWQAFILVKSLLLEGKVFPSDIKAHCLPDVSLFFRQRLSDLGVKHIDILPFEDHPYCNKIEQSFSNAFEGYDKVILLDCDLFFLSLPEIKDDDVFAAKVVDMPNPTLSILDSIYSTASIKVPLLVPVDSALSEDEKTYENNFNGGMYVIDVEHLSIIGESWKKHALWLLDNIALLGEYSQHVDQVSLSLALSELNLPYRPIKSQDNFPVHLPEERIRQLDRDGGIQVLHYHYHVLPSGKIKNTGVEDVDIYIEMANQALDNIFGQYFDNEIFWNMRYELFPELGSGVGSRGETLVYKRKLLENLVKPYKNKKVVDIGCGDLETTRELSFEHYTGYDLSESALLLAREKRPDWQFFLAESERLEKENADLVICLDVLLHQKSRLEYDALISQLVDITSERLIVAGYNAVPEKEYASEICAYHEPLEKSLRKTGAFHEILEVGQYRGLSVFIADKSKRVESFHKTDIPVEILEQVSPMTSRKDLLVRLMDISRKHLGFFTKTSIRSIEYPWMLEQLENLESEARILDIGAGVSPLPIALAEYGYFVDCVDNHPKTRTPETRSEWNEWGYIDYSQFSSNLRSVRENILKFKPNRKFDAIYSVSVIEHMPRLVWEKTLYLASAWLKEDGLLLITLDLKPETTTLWNLSDSQIVDADEDKHGTFDVFVKTLASLGFVIIESQILRSIPFSRTDVAFIKCRMEKKGSLWYKFTLVFRRIYYSVLPGLWRFKVE